MKHCHFINELKDRSKETQIKYTEAIKNIQSKLLNLSKKDFELNEFNKYANETGQLEDLELCQLGLKGSVRVIYGEVDNTLYPFLIELSSFRI